MSRNKNDHEKVLENIRPSLEKMLIETYLMGKGYTLKELKRIPEEEIRRLMKEASTFASCKLAEIEAKARFMQILQTLFLAGNTLVLLWPEE
jgi:hypothetical protein